MTYRLIFCTFFLQALFSGLYPIIFECAVVKGTQFVLYTCLECFSSCFFSGSYLSSALNMSFVFETHTYYGAGGILNCEIKMPVSTTTIIP